MADKDTQDRVAKLVDALTALGSATKGTPLRASDWNTVVGAVLDLARLALARDQTEGVQLDARYAQKVHNHVGEVDASWFTPAARDLLDQRTTGGNDVRADLRTAQDALASLRKDLAALQDQVKKLQLGIDGLSDKDQVREQALSKIDLKVEGLRVLQGNVEKLQASFGTIGTRLDDALAFRNKLSDASGAPIDVAGLAGRVVTLESNQDALKGPDGKLVRFRDVDGRIAVLEGKALTKDNIDSAITDRLKSGDLFDPTALSNQVLIQVRADTDAKFKTAGDRLDGLTTGLADAQTKVATHTTALGDLGTRVGATESKLGTVDGLASAQKDLVGRMNAVEVVAKQNSDALQPLAGITGRVLSVEGRLAGVDTLAKQVKDIGDGLVGINDKLGRLDKIDVRLSRVETLVPQIAANAQRVSALETTVSQTRGDLDAIGGKITVLQSERDDAATRLTRLEGVVRVRPGPTIVEQPVGPLTRPVSRPGGGGGG